MISEEGGKMEKNRINRKRKRNALILLPSLEKGDGSAGAVMNYYDALVIGGWKVDFLLIRSTENNRTSEIRKNGGHIFVLPPRNKYTSSVKKKLVSVIKNGDYSVIHINVPGHIAYLALTEGEKNGIPVRIFHCHNPKNRLNLKTKISTALYDSLCLKHASQLIACSKSAGLSRYGSRSFEVVRNLISVRDFRYDENARAVLRRKISAEYAVLVGVVGRITAQKNPLFLIECFEAFQKKEPRAKLLWIGEGELLEKVQALLKAKGLLNACIFAGRLDDVGQWYSAMDLFLLQSLFEGLGIVFLEAQCSGLLCFGSDAVPPETEVTELMHRIPLCRDAEFWAAAMVRELRNAAARRDRGEDLRKAGYTIGTTADELLTLYNTWYIG